VGRRSRHRDVGSKVCSWCIGLARDLSKRVDTDTLYSTPRRLMFLASNNQHGQYEMQVSGLEAIHNELRSLNERLDFIEDLVEEVILRQLPKAKASAREIAEIKKSIAEMRAGKSVTLEELACA
jgi:hypothetical protein